MSLLKHAQFHGAIRLADSKHRWCWVAALVFLVCSSALVLVQVLQRFFESPTILVKLNSNQDQVAFPCVIVCPEIDYAMYKIDRFLDEVVYPTNINKSTIKPIIRQLAAYYAPDVRYRVSDLELIQQLLDYNDMSMEVAAEKLTSNCSDTLIRCGWRGEIVDCLSLFTMELTADGFCCVFNGRSLRREIAAHGVYKIKPGLTYRTDRVGYLHGVTLVINQSQELHNIDLSYKWLALQGGNGYVDVSINGTALSVGVETWFAFYQSYLRLSSEARGWGRGLLKCRLKDEGLKYFPVYSWRYCLLECEIEKTLNNCGCVRPSHPKLPGTRACSANRMECARHAAESSTSCYNDDLFLVAASSSNDCNCPHACEMESDYIEMQTFHLIQDVLSYDALYDGLDVKKSTVVRAFVYNHYSPTFNRRPIQTSLDLFSNLGGVFNVYLGVSVLTSLEIIFLVIAFVLGCFRK